MGVFPCLSWPVRTARDHQEEPRLCLFQMVYHAAWGRMGLHFRGRQGLWNRNCRKESFRLQTFGACPLPSWASGSGGRAIRLKRGDVDWVSPHKARERQYCDRSGLGYTMCFHKRRADVSPFFAWMPVAELGKANLNPALAQTIRQLKTTMAGSYGNFFLHRPWQLSTLFPSWRHLVRTVWQQQSNWLCLPSTSLIGQSWGLQSLFCCRQTFTNHSCSWKKRTTCLCNALFGTSWLMIFSPQHFNGIRMRWHRVFCKDTAVQDCYKHVNKRCRRQICMNIGIPHQTQCGTLSTLRWWKLRRHATSKKTSMPLTQQTQKMRMRKWWLQGQLWHIFRGHGVFLLSVKLVFP